MDDQTRKWTAISLGPVDIQNCVLFPSTDDRIAACGMS